MSTTDISPCETEEQALYDEIEYGMRLIAAKILNGAKTPEKLTELADTANACTDQLIEDAKSKLPSPLPLACKAGCAWCCYLMVETTVPEAIRIADHLRKTLSPEELTRVRDRVAKLDNRTRGLNKDERSEARLPCALLVDGRCSIYPVRPLKCRGGNSTDADICRQNYEQAQDGLLPVYLPQLILADCIQSGLDAGLTASGLPSERLELTAALRIALEAPDAAERWWAGEPVFAPAKISENS